MWLPYQKDITVALKDDLPEGIFNHPVVIARELDEYNVLVFLVSHSSNSNIRHVNPNRLLHSAARWFKRDFLVVVDATSDEGFSPLFPRSHIPTATLYFDWKVARLFTSQVTSSSMTVMRFPDRRWSTLGVRSWIKTLSTLYWAN